MAESSKQSGSHMSSSEPLTTVPLNIVPEPKTYPPPRALLPFFTRSLALLTFHRQRALKFPLYTRSSLQPPCQSYF